MPGPAEQATTPTVATGSRPATWVSKRVIRIRSGRPAAMPASTAAPGSSTWTWTFQRSGPPTTRRESPRGSRVARSVSTFSGVESRRRYITS